MPEAVGIQGRFACSSLKAAEQRDALLKAPLGSLVVLERLTPVRGTPVASGVTTWLTPSSGRVTACVSGGGLKTLPDTRERDSMGLPMEMV